MGICIVLAKDGSRVIVNGIEITNMVTNIEIAHAAGDPPLVTLTLNAPVQLMGDVALKLQPKEPKA
jgi:hypothetical protein